MARAARKFYLGLIIPLAVGFTPASAVTAQVVDVYDGDTLTVELDGVRERVRLIGIADLNNYRRKKGLTNAPR